MEHLGKQRNALFTDVKERGWPASSRNVLLFTKFTIKNCVKQKKQRASLTDRDERTNMYVQSVIFQLHSQRWSWILFIVETIKPYDERRKRVGVEVPECSKTSAYQMAEQIWKPPPPPNTLLTFHWRRCDWQFQQTFDNPTKATIPRSNPIHTAVCQV